MPGQGKACWGTRVCGGLCCRAQQLNGQERFTHNELPILLQQFQVSPPDGLLCGMLQADQGICVIESVFVHHMGCLFRSKEHAFLRRGQPRRGDSRQAWWEIMPLRHDAVPLLAVKKRKREQEQ